MKLAYYSILDHPVALHVSQWCTSSVKLQNITGKEYYFQERLVLPGRVRLVEHLIAQSSAVRSGVGLARWSEVEGLPKRWKSVGWKSENDPGHCPVACLLDKPPRGLPTALAGARLRSGRTVENETPEFEITGCTEPEK